MELRQINYFMCLYEQQNVTKAAAQLNVVQPAISMQIRKLEREIGEPLFVRTPRGVVPTAKGHQAYELFRPIMCDLSVAQQTVKDVNASLWGKVSIGLVGSVTHSALADALKTFTEQASDVAITVMEGYSQAIAELVAIGRLDVGMINRLDNNFGLVVEPVMEEDFVLLTSGAPPRRSKPTIDLRDLSCERLVLPSELHGLRAVLNRHLLNEGIRLDPRLEIDALNTIADFVAATDWITILPRLTMKKHVLDGRLCAYPISYPRMVRNLVQVHHPQRPPTRAARHFLKLLSGLLNEACGEAHREGLEQAHVKMRAPASKTELKSGRNPLLSLRPSRQPNA